MRKSEPRDLVIVGAGGLGREIASFLTDADPTGASWKLLGFVDDRLASHTVEGWPILGPIEMLYNMSPAPWAAVAIADPRTRMRIFTKIKENNVPVATLIHPSVKISGHVLVGEGCIVCAGSVITTNVTLGKACIINPGCFIGHDTVVADWVSLMPKVSIAGEVQIGQGCYLGISSTVINKIAIGEWCVIGAGATVVGEIAPGSLAVGVPARVVKTLPILNSK